MRSSSSKNKKTGLPKYFFSVQKQSVRDTPARFGVPCKVRQTSWISAGVGSRRKNVLIENLENKAIKAVLRKNIQKNWRFLQQISQMCSL